MIWWLWTAFRPAIVNVIFLAEWWNTDDPDVYWLGEVSWTGMTDNMGIGLR